MANLTKKQMMYKERARKGKETRRRNREKHIFNQREVGVAVPTNEEHSNKHIDMDVVSNTSYCYTEPTISKLIEDNRLGLDLVNRCLNEEIASLRQSIYKLEKRINQLEARIG